MLSNKITKKNLAKTYLSYPSLADRLPWQDYNQHYQCFLLEDNKSLGVCFSINPIPCEARPETMLAEIVKAIGDAIKNSIPLEKHNPWVLQIYVSKHHSLNDAYTTIENYYEQKSKKTLLTQTYLETLNEHFNYVSKQGGIFHDHQVTNTSFRGGLLHVYADLYRHEIHSKKTREFVLEEIVTVSQKFCDQLRICGLKIKKMDEKAFSSWMSRWFNPQLEQKDLTTIRPIGTCLAEQFFYHVPESFAEGWLLDGMPHKVVTIQHMTIDPAMGHLTAERSRASDDKVFNFVDHLPEGSVFALTIVMQSPSEVELHLKSIQASAVGNHALALKIKQEISTAETSIAEGDPLFPVSMALYIRGNSVEDLSKKEAQAEVLLNNNGFKVITQDELFPIDAYLRYLPMCYNFELDRKYSQRYRYVQLSDIAKLLPFYGRSRGTQHPGMVMFNRGGEPWFYDLMVDKTKNAHFLLLGETGTGKSNLLNYLIMQDLALYNSRFFIIDAGGSFDLLGDYCKSLNLTVRKLKIDPKNPVSLNPFAHGLRVIDQIEAISLSHRHLFIEQVCDQLIEEQATLNIGEIDNEPRDILGDMVLAALIMITGGEKREEETIRRSDRMLIMDAIINAAYFVKEQQREQMIASDIVEAFERIAQGLDYSRDAEKIRRAREMADAMRYFVNDPVSSQFFNSYGKPWELADITIVDFGLFANEGYEAQRSIAFAGCMSRILALAEINQHADKSIKVVLDENHIFTSISLLADIETRIAKMGRKLGLWLWIATQNLRDFSDNARRMLAQIEHWICLALPPDELDQIQRFKILTQEQRSLFLSARKEKGKYTEGIFLCPKLNELFRNVPPRLYLAMAATDQDEKNRRRRVMQEFNCSEIEAVKIIARGMMGDHAKDSVEN